jgi:hypothetical protein
MVMIAETISKENKQRTCSLVVGERKDHGKNYLVSGNLFIVTDRTRVPEPSGEGFQRGCINKFSESSGRRMRRYLRECVPEYVNMVTLTYPYGLGRSGSESKQHLKRFIQELKRYSERDGDSDLFWSVFWFMEFQKNGAIHYHLFTTHRFSKEFIANCWYRIVGSEDERHLRAGTRIEKLRAGRKGTISYAAKYAVKSEQKEIPDEIKDAGRFWGVSGSRATMAASTFVSAEHMELKVVKRSINKLRDAIKDGLRLKNLEKLKTNRDGITIYVIKTEFAKAHLETLLYFLQCKVMIHDRNPRRIYESLPPELKENWIS